MSSAQNRKSAFRWLLAKEWRELQASRAWWIFLLMFGPLVGLSFISAVRTYAEASNVNAGAGEAFSPLIGIWAPTFSACELAAAFLLPFVAIRVVATDRQNGALRIEMQHAMPVFLRVLAKALVLLGAWLIAMLAPVAAILLWKSYGGSIYAPEVLTVFAGHLLNAGLTIALGAACAAVAEHPATAAILTLSVTVGAWILNFVAAIHGGIWQRAADYTPTAMVAQFQHALVQADVVIIALVLIIAGLAAAAIWLRLGVAMRKRALESVVLAMVIAAAIFGASFLRASHDFSESRVNSFPRADELALRAIRTPLRIEVHLAPEDPRRNDLDRRTISKLGRVMRKLDVQYIAATSTGLFEQASPHYGEIWYELNGRKQMTRATTPESALELIYDLSGVTPQATNDEEFRGHPLNAQPTAAAAVFYGFWPALLVLLFVLHRRY